MIMLWVVRNIKKYDSIANLEKYFLQGEFTGLVKCDVERPKNMFRAVLPTKGENGRLVFNLYPKIKEVYASPELKLALEKGYKENKNLQCLQI